MKIAEGLLFDQKMHMALLSTDINPCERGLVSKTHTYIPQTCNQCMIFSNLIALEF